MMSAAPSIYITNYMETFVCDPECYAFWVSTGHLIGISCWFLILYRFSRSSLLVGSLLGSLTTFTGKLLSSAP